MGTGRWQRRAMGTGRWALPTGRRAGVLRPGRPLPPSYGGWRGPFAAGPTTSPVVRQDQIWHTTSKGATATGEVGLWRTVQLARGPAGARRARGARWRARGARWRDRGARWRARGCGRVAPGPTLRSTGHFPVVRQARIRHTTRKRATATGEVDRRSPRRRVRPTGGGRGAGGRGNRAGTQRPVSRRFGSSPYAGPVRRPHSPGSVARSARVTVAGPPTRSRSR